MHKLKSILEDETYEILRDIKRLTDHSNPDRKLD